MLRCGVFALSCVLVSGCTGPSPSDAGTDVPRADVGSDSGIDGGGDPPDAPSDVGVDGGSDAPLDAPMGCDGGDAVEVCDGDDDDCDGVIDDGCTCRQQPPVAVDDGFHIAIAVSSIGTIALAAQDFTTGALTVRRYLPDFSRSSPAPNLVIDADRPANDLYLFTLGSVDGDVGGVWRQWPDTSTPTDEPMFARIDGTTGLREHGPLSLAPGIGGLGHSVAPLGDGFVMARNEPGTAAGVAVTIFDADGVVVAPPRPVSEALTVAYTGVGVVDGVIGVAYQATDGTGDVGIRFARFDADGELIDAPIVLSSEGGVRPDVAAQLSGWGVVWEGADGPWLAVVAPDGTIAVTAQRVGIGGGQGLSIAADGSGNWGVIHRDAAPGALGTRFVQIDGDGEPAGEALLAGYSVDGTAILAHDGARYLAAVFGSGSALWVPCETR